MDSGNKWKGEEKGEGKRREDGRGKEWKQRKKGEVKEREKGIWERGSPKWIEEQRER